LVTAKKQPTQPPGAKARPTNPKKGTRGAKTGVGGVQKMNPTTEKNKNLGFGGFVFRQKPHTNPPPWGGGCWGGGGGGGLWVLGKKKKNPNGQQNNLQDPLKKKKKNPPRVEKTQKHIAPPLKQHKKN